MVSYGFWVMETRWRWQRPTVTNGEMKFSISEASSNINAVWMETRLLFSNSFLFFFLSSSTWPERRGEEIALCRRMRERNWDGDDDTLGKQITITHVSRARTNMRHAESRKNDEEMSGGNASDRKDMVLNLQACRRVRTSIVCPRNPKWFHIREMNDFMFSIAHMDLDTVVNTWIIESWEKNIRAKKDLSSTDVYFKCWNQLWKIISTDFRT